MGARSGGSSIALGKLPFRLLAPAPGRLLVGGTLPAPVLAPSIAQRIVVIEPGINAVGDEVVGRAHDLGRRAHDDRVGRNARAVGDEAVTRDDRVLADDDALHDGGADPDQAMIANLAAVQDNAMRDRAILTDD